MSKRSSTQITCDVLGIGFGPSNLAVAVALEESRSPLTAHFIEATPQSGWHPSMLLDGSDIQNNPLRDLVTPRNPRSHYSFTNYLHCQGRLFDYLNLGLAYPLRKEYARYIQWVAGHFEDRVTYSAPARTIAPDGDGRGWVVSTPDGEIRTRSILVGTGRSHNIPANFVHAMGERVFHLCDYLRRVSALGSSLQSIAVIGASQSAVEINLDLLARFPKLRIHALHRTFAMRQKDTSPFSDHVYFPDFVDYYFKAGKAAQIDLQRQLRGTNYSSADIDVLHKLYLTLYEERLDGRDRFTLHNNTTVDKVQCVPGGVALTATERFLGTSQTILVDAVVLATGFKDIGVGEGKERVPPLLSAVERNLDRDADGAVVVQRDYSVRTRGAGLCYLNGLCESSHGFGDAGSFSLLALRAAEIVGSLESGLKPHPEAVSRSNLLTEVTP